MTSQNFLFFSLNFTSDGVAQSVICLTADPGVASSIPARYHTFVEIDHEIISTVKPLSHWTATVLRQLATSIASGTQSNFETVASDS